MVTPGKKAAKKQAAKKPAKKELPAPDVREFRRMLDTALKARPSQVDESVTAVPGERAIGSNKWGVYAFYDFEGEPIYVGQTNERLSGRVRRHLTNQRTDAVGMRVLDPYEIRDLELWPLPQYESTGKSDVAAKLH